MLFLWWFYCRFLVLTPVRTEARFTVNDPWNQDRSTPFVLEAYTLVSKGVRPPAGRRESDRYGIRPEPDAVDRILVEHSRMLPESLARLWLAGRIPAQALPRLLHEMEPTLKWSDRHTVVLTRAYTILQWYMTILCALWLLARITRDIRLAGHGPAGWGTTTIASVVLACVLNLMFFRPRARRKKQMEWALAHL
jgi:hypothetical protein